MSFHPDDAAFASLLDYLADQDVARSLKRRTLQTFISNSEHLPPDWRHAIPDAIGGIDMPHRAVESPFESHEISGEVSFLTVLLADQSQNDAASHMYRLLAGDERQRAWAARLAGSELHEDLRATLAVLISDSAPAVRSIAAAALVSLAETDRADPLTHRSLISAGADPGTLVPIALATEAARWSIHSTTVRELLDRLHDHESATVRSRASQAL